MFTYNAKVAETCQVTATQWTALYPDFPNNARVLGGTVLTGYIFFLPVLLYEYSSGTLICEELVLHSV